ncbi:MAG: hypothetical protein AAFR62_06775 [Cyanobacteria bacterium J06629_2]
MKKVAIKFTRKIKRQLLIILLLISAWLGFSSINNLLFWVEPTEIENALINLGNPLATSGITGRSLNVWDLQAFEGKIYLGGGSTVDNTGPIDVLAYNPARQKFEKEYTVQEEAIEHYRVFDNQLYIPASDPKIGDSNKFYRRDVSGTWQLYQSKAIALAHVRDLIKLDTEEILLVGNNRSYKQLSKPATAITTDGGKSFQEAGINNPPDNEFNWFFSVFTYQEKIYAPTSLLRDCLDEPGTIAVYNPRQRKFELDLQLDNSEFIPQSCRHGFYIIYRLWHPVEFQGALVYPARSYSYYDRNKPQAYMNTIDLYVKPAPEATPFAVTFPDGKSVGEDLLVIDNRLYAIANAKIAKDKFLVYLYKTNDPTVENNWQEVLHFRSSNKVRSFEYLDGKFYFGLGQDYGDRLGKAGSILSISDTSINRSAATLLQPEHTAAQKK